MSLHIYMTATIPTTVFETGITHNLNTMASKVPVGNEITLYTVLWKPEEIFGTKIIAYDLIKFLDIGLIYLQNNKDKLQKHNPSNGWGRL